jgi:hypothetical protein
MAKSLHFRLKGKHVALLMNDLVASQIALRMGCGDQVHISRIFEASHVGLALCKRGLKFRHLIGHFESAIDVCNAVYARNGLAEQYDVSGEEIAQLEQAMTLLEELYQVTPADIVYKALLGQIARLSAP